MKEAENDLSSILIMLKCESRLLHDSIYLLLCSDSLLFICRAILNLNFVFDMYYRIKHPKM